MSYTTGFAATDVTVRGVLPIGDEPENVTYFVLDTDKNALVGQVILPKSVKRSLAVAITVKVPSTARSLAIGTFGEAGTFETVRFLRVDIPSVRPPEGAVGPS